MSGTEQLAGRVGTVGKSIAAWSGTWGSLAGENSLRWALNGWHVTSKIDDDINIENFTLQITINLQFPEIEDPCSQGLSGPNERSRLIRT
jgi:hypothetical protein